MLRVYTFCHLPVYRDGHEGEHGDGDGEVGDEVVDGAVQRAEDPIPESEVDFKYLTHYHTKIPIFLLPNVCYFCLINCVRT